MPPSFTHSVVTPGRPAEFVPYLEDETGLPADHIPTTESQRKKIPKHMEFTAGVTRALEFSPGLTCILIEGLDGFCNSYPRLERYLQQLEFPVCLVHIFTTTTASPTGLTGPGFAYGTLADGRYYTFSASMASPANGSFHYRVSRSNNNS
jgi:hypothetical protein